MYVCIYVYVCLYVFMFAYIYLSVHVYFYECDVNNCIYLCTYVLSSKSFFLFHFLTMRLICIYLILKAYLSWR